MNPFSDNALNWFDPQLLLGVASFDIVIGNPPYVQLQHMSNKYILKSIIKKRKSEYETYTGRGDLYVLFYERGVELLSKNGFLTYITSNQWMRSSYGALLRDYFVKKTNPIRVVDLGGGRFKGTSVDTNIITLQKCENRHKLRVTKYIGDCLVNISKYVSDNEIEIDFSEGKVWSVLTSIEQRIIKKIEATGLPLNDWDLKINFGIKTGCNYAYIIDQKTRDRLIAEDPKNNEIIRPLLRGRDIRKGSFRFSNIYLIMLHNGYYDNEEEFIDPIFSFDYPKIEEYLDQFTKRLKMRKDQGFSHYNLRTCNYLEDFKGQVICWQRITSTPTFCASAPGMVVLDSCGIISKFGDNLEHLLSILNSKLFAFWVDKIVHQLGESGYRLSMQHLAIFNVPLKTHPDKSLTEMEVFKLYNLSDEEIQYLLEY
jgi:hypothetical protein